MILVLATIRDHRFAKDHGLISRHAKPADPLILHALGASEDLVIDDYLLTNRLYRIDAATAASIDLPDAVKAVLISVEQSFLAAAFDTIQSDYGDLEAYFEDGLGLGTRERAMLELRGLKT